MTVTETIWFTVGNDSRCIGIVLGFDDRTKESKALIGFGHSDDEALDIAHICQHGAKIHPHAIDKLVEHFQ